MDGRKEGTCTHLPPQGSRTVVTIENLHTLAYSPIDVTCYEYGLPRDFSMIKTCLTVLGSSPHLWHSGYINQYSYRTAKQEANHQDMR